jgi:predicted DNA-binding transcriptional regulator AlpA
VSEPTTTTEPLAVSATGAARLLAISRTHLFDLAKTGRFGPEPVRLGRSVRYRVDEVRSWLAAGCPPRSKWQVMRAGAP